MVNWELKLTNNNLEAYVKYSLLEGEKGGEVPVTEQDLKEFLSQKGIVYGIIEENIPEVLANPDQFMLIARGKEPLPPVPDEIITYFTAEEEKYSVDKLGHRIYYFKSLPQVNEGQLLAEVKRGKPGEDGIDVFGKPVKAKGYIPVKLKAQKGAEIKDDKVYATVKGLPVRIGHTGFGVQNLLTLDRDLTYKTGNYQFVGSIKVNGNVLENVLLKAEGSVEVFGNVDSAKIYAGESFIGRKNVINSEITVGLKPMLAAKIVRILNEFRESFHPLLILIQELLPNLNEKPVTLFRVLQQLYKKPEELNKLLEKIKKTFQGISENKPELEAFWRAGLDRLIEVERVFAAFLRSFSETFPASVLNQKINLWWHLIEMGVKYFQEEQQNAHANPFQLTVYSGQNSKFNVFGDFILNGKSLYHCTVTATGSIFAEGGTVVVGGKLQAGKMVDLDEVGTPMGTTMEIVVGKESTVKIKKVNPGVLLKIGRFQKTFRETEYGVLFAGEKDL
ncbi:DUF342 domain-containing protein [Carboxydothermus hydrogenoformans]|uniref:Flagellar Assembly Protein A N-terminal region domain-containing protein n=1 Tax=Carboxydothermus hydrogenoformans (strain ATCC BAA-161 / DSM 6008 / Z-2901) TaxID=246194 RepID=Q3ADB6_CARHZ|nr:FapA family protein [Carboxydothermus hydrogenoformans]ABB13991.1 conserved hypothetical protein [Carboxydothermus hydrogenoformans Z-2901]